MSPNPANEFLVLPLLGSLISKSMAVLKEALPEIGFVVIQAYKSVQVVYYDINVSVNTPLVNA